MIPWLLAHRADLLWTVGDRGLRLRRGRVLEWDAVDMNYRLTFELTGLPRMTNGGGGTRNHWVLHKLAQEWKGRAILAAKAEGLPEVPLKTARLVLTRYSSVSPDPDGLVSGFKPIVDGLVAAGVLENDRFDNIGMPDYRWEKVPQRAGKVRVEVIA